MLRGFVDSRDKTFFEIEKSSLLLSYRPRSREEHAAQKRRVTGSGNGNLFFVVTCSFIWMSGFDMEAFVSSMIMRPSCPLAECGGC